MLRQLRACSVAAAQRAILFSFERTAHAAHGAPLDSALP